MNTIAICCGGALGEWSLPILREANFIIGADRGALFVLQHNLPLGLAVGDFDSCSEDEVNLIQHAAKVVEIVDAFDKNDTDSGLALQHALAYKPTKIILLGVTGTRIDHVLNNIQLLSLAEQSNVTCEIIDANNRIQLVSTKQEMMIKKSDYKFVSLIPLTERVVGIDLSGFAYPLNNATFEQGSAIGVSNELLESIGTVSIRAGKLLVIESRD